ncbi:MAG: DUF975 family protein [Candidatus Kapabacteria bacterium]|nr:DUF975 family protein [Candidatus Kapabacteria bacterium]
MISENAELMRQARESLKGKWGLAIGTFVLLFIIEIIIGVIPILGTIATLIIGGPLELGMIIFCLNIARNNRADVAQIFEGFKRFGPALVAYILVAVFTLLWMLLLIIPGIIAALAYSQTFFILADNEDINPRAAMKQSRMMMDGFKWKFFCLECRFIGWAILCILTLGIGFLWFMPYVTISMTHFYEDLVRFYNEPQSAQASGPSVTSNPIQY